MKKQVLLSLALIVSAAYLTLNAQNWNEIIKATASDAATEGRFGYSVAIDGNYAIVGAYLNDDAGSNSGSAYIFMRSGNTWTEQAKLTASDAAANDFFGFSVAIAGDYAIVGAYGNDAAGPSSGSAYIFVRSGNSWAEQAKLTASDAAANDFFGFSVAIEGDYAVIGVHQNDDAGPESGSTYIFVRSGNSWTEQTKLTASDAALGDYFGYSVAIDGNYVIVSARLNDDAGSSSGSAYIFVRSGNSWTEQTKLTASDAALGDYFGYSVAIDGNYAIVGAGFNDDAGSNSGSAYIFMRSGNSWAEQIKLTASDAASLDNFGYSVAIAGDYAIVGASGNDDAGSGSGSAYIFMRSGNSWTEQSKLTASDAAASDSFGFSVAIAGDSVIVGAFGNDDAGSRSGSAYFFEKEPPAIVLDQANLLDIIEECEATPTAPTANSGAISATADVAFPITTQGTTVVTWTYDDGNGNTESQTQNIIIDDTTVPILSFAIPSDALIDSCTTEVIVPALIVSDNCVNNNFALDFDGVDDMVTINQTIGSFKTIEFWMYTENGINGSEEFDYLFSFNDSNLKYIGTGNFTSNYTNETLSMVTNFGEIMTTYAVIPPGWNHIAFTGNGSSFNQIIINGESKPVVNNGFPQVFEATTTYLGQFPSSSVSRFNGKLDELRFWDIARTEQDIANDYEEMIDASITDLLAYYDFEDGTGNSTLTDKTGNGAQGVLNNMDINSNWVSTTSPATSVSLTNDFTGTSDASGTYPEGETTVTWIATDANGNTNTLQQIVNIDCSIIYTFNNGVWLPSDPSGIATANDDIFITSGDATIGSNTVANSVSIEAGASLTVNNILTATNITLNSTSTSYSSLLTGAVGSVVGSISYNRFVNANSLGNDLISAPLSGQSWSSFLSPENATALLDNGELPAVYAFAPFDKTTGDYENYDVNTTVNLTSGTGYRAATDSGETLIFTGTIPDAVNVNILDSGPNFTQWNLVGNPYPSYLNVHAFLNHEVDLGVSNIDLFANGSAAIYGYNASEENKWTIYNLANTNTSTLIAPGQGFYVAADAAQVAAYDLEFTTDMQTTGTNDDFILGRSTALIYLKLALSSSTKSYNTEFYFNDNASQG
ncbi:hypothetical protein HNV08_11725 [Winogradskyella eckloniae]|uniref:LamG-like jellyroll fold domain-containing protein n=1 Tax=Winogradskyella eckloniae TaxID=1089306 RepID=UPI0015658AC9|nr:LamG-like jellyroll fold domain-containing protein [Winogradskyella eckloniae]NRD20719.1 hypothetical protein [Winogradskyella eckloniae]